MSGGSGRRVQPSPETGTSLGFTLDRARLRSPCQPTLSPRDTSNTSHDRTGGVLRELPDQADREIDERFQPGRPLVARDRCAAHHEST
jgi:hypothetical protein